MTAVSKVHAHNGIAGLKHGKEHCHISLSAAVGLHIAVLAAKQLLEPVARKIFGYIHKLAAAIITVCGITFGIFIGQMAACGGHYCGRNKVFAGDKLYIALLA